MKIRMLKPDIDSEYISPISLSDEEIEKLKEEAIPYAPLTIEQQIELERMYDEIVKDNERIDKIRMKDLKR